jgi:hypothetical protein
MLKRLVFHFGKKLIGKSLDDPHFKCREEFNGQELKFAAWIEPVGELYRLRILIEPFAAAAGDLSEAALETHGRLKEFVGQAQLRLSSSSRPELPQNESNKAGRKSIADPGDSELDAEPDDIPF